MRSEDFKMATALEIAKAIQERKLGIAEIVNAYIEKIEKNNNQYNTFITVAKESALQAAEKISEPHKQRRRALPACRSPNCLKG